MRLCTLSRGVFVSEKSFFAHPLISGPPADKLRPVMKVRQQLGIFLYGAVGYASIEVICRGYTHWSMALTGGVCLLMLFLINRRMAGRSLLRRAAAGAVAATALELVVGLVVNVWLGWSVWDYTGQPLNLLGQICPRYSLYWFFLTLPVMLFFGRGKEERQAAG